MRKGITKEGWRKSICQPSKIAVQKVKKRPEVATSCDRIYKLNVTLREFQKNSVLTLTFL